MAERRRDRVETWWALVPVGALAGLVVWALLPSAGRTGPLAYLMGLGVAIALVVVLIRSAAADLPEPDVDAQNSVAPDSAPYADMYFLEYRLSWGSVDRPRYEQRVRPLLVRLAEERLRTRHGIDAGAAPESARGIVGEQLWQLMTGPAQPDSPPPGARQVATLVEAIERI